MRTLKDFIENNENQEIIVDVSPNTYEEKWRDRSIYKGMLYDIPLDLQNLEVVDVGYMMIGEKYLLTVIK